MPDNKIMKTLNGYEIYDEKARINKVDLPIDSYGNVNHGNDGQVLISKGNGKTEWKDNSDATVTTDSITKALGYKPANAETVSELHKEIADLKGDVGRAYWVDHIDSKIATIKALQEAGGKDCISFAVITDMHYAQNLGCYSGVLAKKVMDRCGIKHCLMLGDFVSRGTMNTFAASENEFEGTWDILNPIKEKVLATQGNHDGCYGSGNAYNYKLTQIFERVYRTTASNHNVTFDASGTGYYVDDTSAKIRYIMLNSDCRGTLTDSQLIDSSGVPQIAHLMSVYRYTQTQFNMVKEALETVPTDDWVVVACSHVPPLDTVDRYDDGSFVNDMTSKFADMGKMRDLFNAYVNKGSYSISHTDSLGTWANVSLSGDFSNAKGMFAGYFAGHFHVDKIYGSELNGFPIVLHRCDSHNENYDSTNNSTIDDAYFDERVAGTITEQSFDIVTINKITKMVNITKIGAGVDRAYSYEGVEIVTHTITNNFTKVSTSNSNTSVVDGNTYVATLTANDGYELSSVTVKMGGVDITSTAYENGTINIQSVTGDIVITAVATVIEVKPSYNNLADPTSADWKTASRFGSSGDVSSSSANAIVTNYIPCKQGDVIRVKGLDVTSTLPDGKVCRSAAYNGSKTCIGISNTSSTNQGDYTISNGVTAVTLKSTNFNYAEGTPAFVRMGGTLTGSASDVIITINEEIN